MRIGLICDNRQWTCASEPFRAVAAGLRRLGHQVEVVARAGWPLWDRLPEVVFLWNGIHGPWGEYRRRLAAEGVPVLIMERGFFDRFNYTQIDRAGFNHAASWSSMLAGPAPSDGLRRFVRAWGREPAPFGLRKGYALVLLQVPSDAQLEDAAIRHPGPLVEAVDAAAPAGLKIRIRAHPLSRWQCGRPSRAAPIARDGDRRPRAGMLAGKLRDAVAGAKFCITINSNAGNEALAWGCPVLCLGPALYAIAGVARQVAVAELWRGLAEMDAGWRPDEQAVRSYLAHLACRQWSRDELADGWPLERLLKAALS